MTRMFRLALLTGASLLAVAPALAQSPGTFSDLTYQRSWASGVAPLDLTYTGTPNPNAIVAAPGNMVSFCPVLSCISGGDFSDHQRASLLVSARTQVDGLAEEQTLAVTTTIGTGYARPYAASTAYNVGDNINIGNATYRAIQAGTTGQNSAPPGARPSSQSATFNDGTVVWKWINDAYINSKVGSYFETQVVDGAGAAWGAAFNYHIQTPPKPGMFLPGVEMDYANDSGVDCALGIDCTALRMGLAGNAEVTHGIQITGDGSQTTGYSARWALRINGDRTARLAAIAIDANSMYGLAANQTGLGGDHFSESFVYDNSTSLRGVEVVGAKAYGAFVDGSNGSSASFLAGGTKTTAVFQDIATAPKSIVIQGTKTVASIEDTATSPAALSIGGAKSFAGIFENSTTPVALRLNGSYSDAQILGNNFRVWPDGGLNALNYNVNGTSGASCSGSPTSNFRVQSGIVVAC